MHLTITQFCQKLLTRIKIDDFLFIESFQMTLKLMETIQFDFLTRM